MTVRGAVFVDEVVDTDRYPLLDPTGAAFAAAVARARGELRRGGCTVLPGFLRPSYHDVLQQQCAALADLAYYDVETVNVYNSAPDPSLPADHPVNTTTERGNAFVARDQIPVESIIARLYRSPAVQHFIACCAGLPRVHELADPFAGLCLNVVRPGGMHPWHFDTNELAVSMVTQEPRAGGVFEFCPAIRSAADENFGDVAAVLAGGGEHLVHRLVPRAGDLQLFRGRYSLHRVDTVRGDVARHSAIFAYSERPGVISTAARTRQLFGRLHPAHLAGTDRPVRVDQLLD